MEQIKSYDALSQLVSAHLTRGVCTNIAVSQARFAAVLASGALYAIDTPQALLLLVDRESHHRLYFFLHDLEAPLPLAQLPRPTLTEIAFRPRDARLQEAIGCLQAQGMRQLFLRHRFARTPEAVPPPRQSITVAALQDRDRVDALLKAHYSPLTGCLPNREELEADLDQGRFLLLEQDGELLGLLHYTLEEKTAEMRHMIVPQEHRGKGYSNVLVAAHLARITDRKSLAWTREGNTPTERTFATQGFRPDGWRSAVLCCD